MQKKAIWKNNEDLDIMALLRCEQTGFYYDNGEKTIQIKLLDYKLSDDKTKVTSINVKNISPIQIDMQTSLNEINDYMQQYLSDYFTVKDILEKLNEKDIMTFNSKLPETNIRCDKFRRCINNFLNYFNKLTPNPYKDMLTGKDVLNFIDKEFYGEYISTISDIRKPLFDFLEKEKGKQDDFALSLDYINEGIEKYAIKKLDMYLNENNQKLNKKDYIIEINKITGYYKDAIEKKLAPIMSELYYSKMPIEVALDIDKYNALTNLDFYYNNKHIDIDKLLKGEKITISMDNRSAYTHIRLKDEESVDGKKYKKLIIDENAYSDEDCTKPCAFKGASKDAIISYMKDYIQVYKELMKKLEKANSIDDSKKLYNDLYNDINQLALETKTIPFGLYYRVSNLLHTDILGSDILNYMRENNLNIPYKESHPEFNKMFDELQQRSKDYKWKEQGVEELDR